jgi:NAD(P)H:quinone oxidoreductase type IV
LRLQLTQSEEKSIARATGDNAMPKVQVVFYSAHGHVYQLAQAIAAGAAEVPETEVGLYRVAELSSEDEKRLQGPLADVPIAEPTQLANAHAILFGTPTRFGNMCAQMRSFLDGTTKLWLSGSLIGKIGSVFTSTGTQHGGQETTIQSFHTTLLHHGMIIVGVPYSEQRLMNMDEITGGTPYGASTMAGVDGRRQVSENELAIARFQGRHVAEVARRLFDK